MSTWHRAIVGLVATGCLAAGSDAAEPARRKFPKRLAQTALPRGELPKVVEGHPRLLLRARPWKGGLSVDQLRRRAKQEPWARLTRSKYFRLPKYGPQAGLYYLIAGDKSLLGALVEYVMQARPGWSCGGSLVGRCMVYDWIAASADLDDPTRKRMRDHIAKVAFECAKAQESGSVNDMWHHRGAAGWVSDVLVAGLTLFGEHPDAEKLLAWGAGYFRSNYFRGWARTGGTHMGGGHRYYRSGAGQLPLAIACWQSAGADNVCEVIRTRYNDFLQGNMYAMMYQTLPDKTRVESTGFDYAPKHLMKGNYLVTSWCYKNPDGYAFLRWLGRDPRREPFAIVLYEEEVAAAKPSLPLTGPSVRMWGGSGRGWFGYVQIRSNGWAKDSTVIEFKCGDRFWSHGFNTDQNAFALFHKGRLAFHTGLYADNVYFGSHMRNYYAQTVSSNSMLIIDPKEWCHTAKRVMPTQDPEGFYPVWGGQITHRGGSNCFSFDEFLARMTDETHRFECGDMVAFEPAPDLSYTYVCGDATANYNNPKYAYGARGRRNRPKIDLFTRSLAWLDNAYLVIFDRVRSLDPAFRKAWLFHSQVRPEISGRLIKAHVAGHVEDFDGEAAIVTWGEGKLAPPDPTDPGRVIVRAFLPEKRIIRRIGGKGYEFWAGGRNWPPTRSGWDQSDPQDTGNWRFEVSPAKPAKFDNFLHLLYPCDTRTDKAPAAETVADEGGKMIGLAVGKWVVMFGKRGQVGGEIVYRTPKGKTEHLVVDLKRGAKYKLSWRPGGAGAKPGGETTMTASRQGVLRFTAPEGAVVRVAPVR